MFIKADGYICTCDAPLCDAEGYTPNDSETPEGWGQVKNRTFCPRHIDAYTVGEYQVFATLHVEVQMTIEAETAQRVHEFLDDMEGTMVVAGNPIEFWQGAIVEEYITEKSIVELKD